MTYAKRVLATVIGALVMLAITALGLLLQIRTNRWYAWDAANLGYWIIVAASFAHGAIPRQPLAYRAVGLRLVTHSGRNPPVLVRITRLLLFWVLVAAADTFRVSSLASALPISAREQLLAEAGGILCLTLLSATTCIASGGRRAAHDIICGTVVIPATVSPAKDARDAAARFRGRFLFASTAGLLAIVLAAIVLIDWRYRISDVLIPYFKHREPYISNVVEQSARDRSRLQDITVMDHPEDVYWNRKQTAFLVGPVETFRYRVSHRASVDPLASQRTAFNGILDAIPLLAPSTRLVVADVYTTREFGPAIYEEGQSYVMNVRDGRYFMTFAPASQDFFFGKSKLSLEQRLKRDDNADSVITHFVAHIDKSVFVGTSTHWSFPYLDLLQLPGDPESRMLGPREALSERRYFRTR